MDIIQFIWVSIPALYFLLALWGWLEKKGRSVKKQNPGDFLKQGTFIFVAVGLAILIDTFWLADIVSVLPAIMPLLFYRIILLPILLFLCAKIFGGSKPHSIKRSRTGRSR
jgi:hypothetical protein